MNTIKKIEIFFKKTIEVFFSKNRKTYNFSNVKDIFYFNEKPKILLLRHDRIGDLIVSTSFIRILRKKLPEAQIDILLSKSNNSAKRCVEKYINKFWIYDKKISNTVKLIKSLKREKYDLIVDLFDNPSTTSAIVIKYADPVFALGIDKKNSFIYDYTVPMLDRFSSHIVERIANLLIVFGINPEEEDLSLEYDLNSNSNISISSANSMFQVREKCFGINLAGGSSSRFWGYENNFNLIKYIKTKYPENKIRVFSTNEYFLVASKLKETFNDININKCNTFNEFALEVSKCNLIISPDTSIVHLAATFNISSIIFYITKENRTHSPWYPFRTKYIALETHEDSITAISFNKVIEALENILDTL